MELRNMQIWRRRQLETGAMVFVGTYRDDQNRRHGAAMAVSAETIEDVRRDFGTAAVKRLYERAKAQLLAGASGWPRLLEGEAVSIQYFDATDRQGAE